MLNRRLILLFIFFFLGALVLGVRLARLQIAEAEQWRQELRKYVHRNDPIDAYRGAILDRNGKVLAQDVPCDDLAIDYRAMNLDDQWLTRKARERMKDEKFSNREEYYTRLADVKEEIAEEIDAIPDVITRVCKIPKEQVLAQFHEIRARIAALHQDMWSRPFNRDKDARGADDDIDADAGDVEVKEERRANTIVHNISEEIATYFRQHEGEYPGLVVLGDSNRRYYPYGDVACQVLGTMRSVDDATVAGDKFEKPNLLTESDPGKLRGYVPADLMGESGAEKILERRLRGTRGVQLIEIGQAADVPVKRIDPIPGADVRLTLDIELQKDLHEAIADPGKGLRRGQDGKNHFVALVVMAMDGEVLAMISWPTYDLNDIDTLREQLNKDTYGRPLQNRALSAYPPGSTVKPLLASGALTEGNVISPTEIITCTGHFFPSQPNIFRCDEVHGEVSLVDALAKSCNVYFYTVGKRMGLERLTHWYGMYGLGHETGFELPDGNGTISNPQNYTEADAEFRESLFEGIGQGKITATPLQMAMAYGTLLRGGIAVTPRIVGDTAVKSERVLTLTPETLGYVRQGMEGVTTRGTAKSIFKNFRMAVAGKTGTAETPLRLLFDEAGKPIYDPARPLLNKDGTPQVGADGKPLFKQAVDKGDDAWFVGYAPADRPQYIVAALMEWGGHGGTAAAPMAREAFLQLEKHNYLPHMDVP